MARVVGIVVALVLGVQIALPKKKPQLAACPGGRFLVADGGALTLVPATPVDAITIAGDRLTLPGCGAAGARLKPARKFTTVTARWDACGDATKVRLTGKIDAETCATLAGKLTRRKAKAVTFRATRSRCGDAVLDTAAGEQCDPTAPHGDTACPGKCQSACTCPPPSTTIAVATTTSTQAPEPSTTETTAPGATTTSTSMPMGTVNGCSPAAAVDRTGQAEVSIFFPGTGTFRYSPSCLKITAGSRVLFNGVFADHPLVGGVYASNTEMPDPTSPFLRPETVTERTQRFRLTVPGSYGYYCDNHSFAGMFGAVHVVPGPD